MGYCLAPKRLVDNHLEIKYFYSEYPDDDNDSGLRFFEGNESQEFLDNPDNIGLYDLETIIEMDSSLPAVLKYLPVGVTYEKIDGVWMFINDDETPLEGRAYFDNKIVEEPVHFGCTLLKLKLPWNNQIIQVYCNDNVINSYYPVVPKPYHYSYGVYLPDICSLRGYFTKDDLEDYYIRCEEKYQRRHSSKNEKLQQMIKKKL